MEERWEELEEEKEKKLKSKNLLEGPIRLLKSLSHTNQGTTQTNFSVQNEANFKTLGQILDDKKIDIIKIEFRLKNKGKISFQEYYKGTRYYSIFQLRGY